MSITAGVIAVQGDVEEHERALLATADRAGLDIEVRAIRRAGIVPECDWLAIPGGESTTISRLLHQEAIAPEIINHVEAGRPILATCAGLIVLAREVPDERVDSLGLLDIAVERNAFGRQRESFEVDLDVVGLDDPFHAIFIRAPAITDAGGTTVLATVSDRPVAVKDGPITATAFHPELTGDARIHHLAFL